MVPHAISTISPLNPLPSPWGNSSDESKGTSKSAASDSPTSSSGAIRLNRVPSSVRLATDLLKSTPSMESSIVLSPLPAGAARQIGGDALKHKESDPNVTIPSTPVATRNATPEEIPLLQDFSSDLPPLPLAVTRAPEPDLTISPARLPKMTARVRGSLPPPSAFTILNDPPVESPPMQQRELVLTADSGSTPGTGTTALDISKDASSTLPRDISLSATEASSGQYQAQIGLGINAATSQHSKKSSEPFAENLSPARDLPERFSDSAGKPQPDVEGDAARHANLIMQTRRAKLQKWRPASAEKEERGFGPSTISAPPRLGRTFSASGIGVSSASAAQRLSAWNFQETESSFARREDSFIDAMIPPTADSLTLGRSPLSAVPINLQEGFTLQVPQSPSDKNAMEKVPSTESNVNGIEWVDWLDEYKKYKEAKIRSEEENLPQTELAGPSESQLSAPSASLLLPCFPETLKEEHGMPPTQKSPQPAQERLQSTDRPEVTARPQHSAAIPVMPVNKLSKDPGQPGSVPQRSASKVEPKRAPTMASSNPQSLYARQTSYSHKGSAKKAKALGNKIEGWWHSVKTNFQNPTSANLPTPKILPFPPKSLPLNQVGPSRAKTPVVKVPSAPPSRRGSVMPLHPEIPVTEATFGEDMQQQASALRTATSHTNLARLNEESSEQPAENAPVPPSPVPAPTLGPRQSSDPTHGQAGEAEWVQRLKPMKRASTGLEARRKQPALSLKLDQQMLALPMQTQRQYSDGSMAASTSNISSSTGSRDATTYSRQTSSIGLTTGMAGWDQTPSPLQALNAKQSQRNEFLSPPQTGATDFNQVSVQRHVKHRLTVAKESCDRDLQVIIADITAYVEELLQRERQASQGIAVEGEGNAEVFDNSERAYGSVSSIGTDGGMTTGLDAEALDRDSSMLPSGQEIPALFLNAKADYLVRSQQRTWPSRAVHDHAKTPSLSRVAR